MKSVSAASLFHWGGGDIDRKRKFSKCSVFSEFVFLRFLYFPSRRKEGEKRVAENGGYVERLRRVCVGWISGECGEGVGQVWDGECGDTCISLYVK